MPTKCPVGCAYPACKGIAQAESAYCDQHQRNIRDDVRARDAQRHARNPWRNWYKLKVWVKHLQPWKLAETPICEKCHRNGAYVVHHIVDHRGNWALFVDKDNLMSLCKPCHDEIEKPHAGRMPRTVGSPAFTCTNQKAVDKALEDTEDLSSVTIPSVV